MKVSLTPSPEEIVALENPAEILAALEKLLASLEEESSRAAACAALHDLAAQLEKRNDDRAHLVLKNLKVPGVVEPLKVILNPAVFSPELWGRTFAEGLLKTPEYFHAKKIVELGTGSGWISLLLLQRTGVSEVLGLDINPVAVTLANINKWLNGTLPDGTLKLSLAGIPIVKAFRAEQSDLLQSPLMRGELFDRVIGCIPQVLHPVPEKAEGTAQDLSYEDLYDLSNYCFNQGILEDRFGLPLIARALEEAQLCLNPQGSLTLILGGRPGQQAIEEMFRRRAYTPRLTWVRRIQQADDTDLVQLVKLESVFDIKFHFFVSPNSRQPIPASTAVGLKYRGERIYHDLLVYQAETQFERPTLGFLRNLHLLGLDQLRRELDLSRVTEEQISFLERLTKELLKDKAIPYPHEKGDLSLREKLATFLSVYCHYDVSPEALFIGPERPQLLSMILKMVARANDKVLLSSSLERNYGGLCRQQGLDVVLGNNDLSELLQLDSVFEPGICIIAPYQLKEPSPMVLDSLIKQAEAHPERCYIVDDSEHFEIGSEIQSNLLLRLLGQKQIPENLIFLYGLIKNTVCPDFELSFLINAPAKWIDSLEYCAELSYSRISFIIELYYEWLFDELLSFPFLDSNPLPQQHLKAQSPAIGTSLARSFTDVASDPVFAAKPIDLSSPKLLRLDYGEFEWPVPDLLVKGLLKGFLESRSDALPEIIQARVAAYILKTRHATIDPQSVVLAQGVFPLFGALVQTLRARLGRQPLVAIARGSYGPMFPLLQYYGAETLIIETCEARSFNITAEDIAQLKQTPDLLYLCQPSNPSGVFIESEMVRKILKICDERGIYIFSDEIFFLLSDSSLGDWTPAELSFAYNVRQSGSNRLFFADGLAKAFAAGGIRCGFMACPDKGWATQISNYCAPVPQTILRAWDRLYSVFMEQSPHQLINSQAEFEELQDYLGQARSVLSEHREKLLALLNKYGLSDRLKYARRGGLFTLAKLAGQAESLAKQKQLLVNTGAWSRTEEWSRLCFSIPPEKFDMALLRLEQFLAENVLKAN